MTPTDTHYPSQWGLHNFGQWSSTPDANVDAPEAWKITTGSPDVLVAVIDNGTDYNHPELSANIWTNPFETASDGIDNDGNGYVDDVHGINTVIDTGDPMADPLGIKAGHGTWGRRHPWRCPIQRRGGRARVASRDRADSSHLLG